MKAFMMLAVLAVLVGCSTPTDVVCECTVELPVNEDTDNVTKTSYAIGDKGQAGGTILGYYVDNSGATVYLEGASVERLMYHDTAIEWQNTYDEGGYKDWQLLVQTDFEDWFHLSTSDLALLFSVGHSYWVTFTEVSSSYNYVEIRSEQTVYSGSISKTSGALFYARLVRTFKLIPPIEEVQ